MPRLRIPDDELDDELDDVEYETGTYERYDGETPPKGTYLRGYVKSLWWTETGGGDRMIKLLWIADGNDGAEEEYNGLPIWENLALTAAAKFKWGPFFEHFGLTIKLLKTKGVIAADDDNIGAPITKIGPFVPGEDSETARCAIITAREKNYKDSTKWDAHVAEWLDDEEPEDADEEEEDDEEVEEEEEDEEEEPPPPPSRRTRAGASGKGTASTATKSAASAKSAASRASTSGRAATKPAVKAGRPAAKAPAAAAKAPARGARKARTNTAGYDDDPPF